MTDAPKEVRELAATRDEARRAGDFSRADELRRRIGELGFDVADTPQGSVLTRKGDEPPVVYRRSEDVPSLLQQPPSFDASVQWVVEGWMEDVARGIDSFRRHARGLSVQHVIVEAAGLANRTWPEDVDLVSVDPAGGWAMARNAGLRRSAGPVVVLVDGSIEATGDVMSPLVKALADRSVGVTGPFGLVTDDLREFREAEGPDVDAVEAYLMAFRRELVDDGLRFDEKFTFYRNADLDLSLQIKAMGLRATVTPVPVIRHEHRMWTNTPEAERNRLSKRNFYRFLDKWRGRTDLVVNPPQS